MNTTHRSVFKTAHIYFGVYHFPGLGFHQIQGYRSFPLLTLHYSHSGLFQPVLRYPWMKLASLFILTWYHSWLLVSSPPHRCSDSLWPVCIVPRWQKALAHILLTTCTAALLVAIGAMAISDEFREVKDSRVWRCILQRLCSYTLVLIYCEGTYSTPSTCATLY